MPNPWFRLYSEFEDDPKVQMMPEVMQLRLVKVLCMRCKEEKQTDIQIAFKWRITAAELAATKALFVESGFIDSSWNVLNWDKRQFLSDSSTDRTRRHRERKRTSQERHRERDVTKCDVQETDTETEEIRREQKRLEQRRAESARATGKRGGKLVSLGSIFSNGLSAPPSTLPRNRAEMIAANYIFSNRSPCKGCGEEIEWWSSPKGARLPMNVMTNGPDGAIVHLETCSSGAEFRKTN